MDNAKKIPKKRRIMARRERDWKGAVRRVMLIQNHMCHLLLDVTAIMCYAVWNMCFNYGYVYIYIFACATCDCQAHILYVGECVCKRTVHTLQLLVSSSAVVVDGIVSTSIKITLPAPFTDILNRVWNIKTWDAMYAIYEGIVHVQYRHVNYTYCYAMTLFSVISYSRSFVSSFVRSIFNSPHHSHSRDVNERRYTLHVIPSMLERKRASLKRCK